MNTTYFLNCAAGNIFNTKTSPALPKTYYIGLSTSAPAINGTGVNEPSTDAGYARVKLSSLGEPVDGVVTNSQAINFNESTASWGTITHFVIYDSARSARCRRRSFRRCARCCRRRRPRPSIRIFIRRTPNASHHRNGPRHDAQGPEGHGHAAHDGPGQGGDLLGHPV